MANYNRCVIMGRLTRDPDVKQAGSTTLCKFSIAVEARFKSGSEWKTKTSFIDCTAWGRTAEMIDEKFHKGSPIHVEGRLESDSWDDKQTGQKRTKTFVTVESVQFLPGGKGDGPTRDTSTRQPEPGEGGDSGPDDEVPF